MSILSDLWVAALTSPQSDSGSESDLVVIMNQSGFDVVHRNLGFGPAATGGGKLYHHDISSDALDVDQPFYMRIGTRGSDAWRPLLITAWGQRVDTGNVVPLRFDDDLDVILSADSSEGRISLPLRGTVGGSTRTAINRVMLVTGTGFGDFGTDSPVHVRITAGETIVVNHTIPDTSQDDLDAAEGNVYFLPVRQSFTRDQLTDTSIELSIEGNDAWRPIVVVMFGLDTASGQPGVMVPLVHVHPWGSDVLSTDPSEGVASVTLPLAPVDP